MKKRQIEIKSAKFKTPKKRKYNKKELDLGIKEEKEHTENKAVRTILSKQHLDKDKHFYSKEKKSKEKKKRKRNKK